MTILNIINQYDSLKKGLRFILHTNQSNNAPYHNLNHLLTVTRHCYEALKYENLLGEDTAEELLMAALFHDYNHSMGELTDKLNVGFAKFHLKEFIIDEEIDLDITVMENIISATEYPYVIASEDLNIYQKIIRDADLCQIYEYDWLKQNIFGLCKELELELDVMIPGQRKFLENIDPLTSYGKFMHNKHFENVLKELTILENIISYEKA